MKNRVKNIAVFITLAVSLTAQANLQADAQFIKLNQLVGAAEQRGLSRDYYLSSAQMQSLEELYRRDRSAFQAVLSAQASRVASDLHGGRLKPSKLIEFTYLNDKTTDLSSHVQNYLSQQISLQQLLQAVEPSNEFYRQQLRILLHLQNAKNQPELSLAGQTLQTLRLDVVNPELVLLLRQRLNLFGYENSLNQAVFDTELEEVVKRFQADHKLTADGIVGGASWRVLGRSLDSLISLAAINVDRARWIQNGTLPAERIWVNITSQDFNLYQNNESVMSFRTIVGRAERKTPIMTDALRSIVLNPTWTVPISIFVRDKLAQIKADPSYVSRMNMRLIDDMTGQVVDAASVDWTAIDETNLHYTLVQMPGAGNALGYIKFPLRNPHAIYMHDTDSRGLFQNEVRYFSSGCVRLEKPFEFAAKVLEAPEWTEESLRMASEMSPVPVTEPSNLRAPRSIPVYLMYQTIFRNSEGKLIVMPDVYGVDQATAERITDPDAYVPAALEPEQATN